MRYVLIALSASFLLENLKFHNKILNNYKTIRSIKKLPSNLLKQIYSHSERNRRFIMDINCDLKKKLKINNLHEKFEERIIS